MPDFGPVLCSFKSARSLCNVNVQVCTLLQAQERERKWMKNTGKDLHFENRNSNN